MDPPSAGCLHRLRHNYFYWCLMGHAELSQTAPPSIALQKACHGMHWITLLDHCSLLGHYSFLDHCFILDHCLLFPESLHLLGSVLSTRTLFPSWSLHFPGLLLITSPLIKNVSFNDHFLLLDHWSYDDYLSLLDHVSLNDSVSLLDILEDTARYAGLLLAPAEGFGLRPRLFLPLGQKKSLLCCFGPFLAIFGVQ